MKRVTLNYGLRFDYHNAEVPDQNLPAALFVPARSFPGVKNVPNWKDMSPRMGIAYDLTGSGRTALKFALGRYVMSEGLSLADANNPIVTSVVSATRTWTDANHDYNPDCDFTNQAANGECAATSNVNFLKNNPNATRYDPETLNGWGKRGSDWEFSAGIQQQVLPGVALNAAYYRHWFGNFTVTQNEAVVSGDFDPYCVTAPVDPRLPNGGGYQICGLYDVKPAKFGLTNNLVTFTDNFGKQRQVYDGVDVNLNARLPHGAFVQGGITVGRTETDTCFASNQPNLATQTAGTPRTTEYCDSKPPLSAGTQIKFSASYKVPWEVTASAVYQNLAGPQITATRAFTSAEISPSLGRSLAAGANSTVAISMIPPNTVFEKRINQLDLRLARPFKVGRARVEALVDIYNAFNWTSVIGENLTYGPNWLMPQNVGWTSFGVLAGRMIKFGTHIDF
jgi:hypothetical protein